MSASKIVSEQEVIKWFEEGRTYRSMVDEYLQKYDLEVSIAMFSNFRRRRGLDRRTVRDTDLIPWRVAVAHRWLNPLNNLRHEARRRAGQALPEDMERSLDAWIFNLKNDGLVVHYDPDTDDGFFYVPARPGIDTDLIREPTKVVRK